MATSVQSRRLPMTSVPSFDGCEAVEKIHSGPVSDLFRAVQEPLGRPVLIKALGASILPSSPFAATIEREARVLARLSHPNIVAVHDFVRRDPRMWLVLEHVDGVTLDELLERARRLPADAALAIVRPLARALAHAHARGIVHRDLRPRNVIVARDGTVKLTNFSVAAEERLPTAPELLDGAANLASLSYQSPEQILGEPPDPRSDLFSLGIVLFELLSGEPPFGQRNDPSAAQRIRNDPLPPLSRYAPDVSAGLERAVQRCLAKLPADRFQSARDLEQALGELEEAGSPEPDIVRRELSRAGLATDRAADLPPRRELPRARTILPTAVGLTVAGLLLAGGFAGIRLGLARDDRAGSARGGQSKLELAPAEPGYLRVVAQPWAHVFVDGEQVETTPFARPIPLAPGLHYVKLTHPSAPDERRDVSLLAGETLVLDVSMKVPVSALTPTPAPAASSSGAPAEDTSP